jgi:hypothetical protein
MMQAVGCFREGVPMERTLKDIQGHIASLRTDLAKYRQLANERKSAGHLQIAEQLVGLIGDIEKRVAELEAMAATKG